MTDVREPLDIAPGITVMDSLKRVLRLPFVCSKRFLTSKVDKCVIGLVAQQQTVGPLQFPLSIVAVIAQTFTDVTGGACAIGEQPIKAKLDGEGAAMYDAATSLSVAMIELVLQLIGIAIDGGKDSLSMAAHVAGEVVKAPGNLVMSVYCTSLDIEDVLI
ncbi:phosphoribosylformylglycinamidine synthase [Pyrus ussuriensis x Pyrus communis]|uniref:Phosphoribosylformylglycinamidine synthase n=1 Tax=Pyrus ussuriensis x Pyrus communis TaxID=2448454 RepID=A0A5N5INC5_9ROSA|nr:phosphoribosylformylglycinamidine synthase [Pyrus ussuriensis x Pyrus communis]